MSSAGESIQIHNPKHSGVAFLLRSPHEFQFIPTGRGQLEGQGKELGAKLIPGEPTG